jgi:hypothetical protein
MKTIGFLALVMAACGGGGGGGGGGGSKDAPPMVPAMITVSGTATEHTLQGTMPVSGATVAAYSSAAPGTVVVMTTTDASGNYSLMLPTMGKPVDGFFKATKSGYTDTYLYAPAPLTADFSGAAVNMLTTGNFGVLFTLCGVSQDMTMGTIAVEVESAPTMTVAGATVSSTPAAAKVCYDSGGLPSRNATATATDGIAILFNVTGMATVSASMSGATFKSHGLNATANAFTTTLITE